MYTPIYTPNAVWISHSDTWQLNGGYDSFQVAATEWQTHGCRIVLVLHSFTPTTDHHGRDYIPLKLQPNRRAGKDICMCRCVYMCMCMKRRGRTSERSGFSHISVIGITSVSQSPTIHVCRHVFLIPSLFLRLILYAKTRQTFETSPSVTVNTFPSTLRHKT